MHRFPDWSFKLLGCFGWVLSGICSGCIFNDPEDCFTEGTCALQFIYTFHEGENDRFADEVEHLELFFFNENDEFVKNISFTVDCLQENHLLDTELAPGNYTVVAWGNTHTEHFVFRENGEINRLEQVRLDLAAGEHITNRPLPSLFHGKEAFTVSPTENQIYPVCLTRNTKTIRLLLSGLSRTYNSLEELNLEITLSGSNGSYDHNNLPVEDGNVVYRPFDPVSRNNHEMMLTLQTLRILEDCDLLLRIWDTREEMTPIVEDPLLPYLIEHSGENVKSISEYLLKTHEFDVIGIELQEKEGGYVVVRLYLPEWDEIEDWEEITPPGKI